MANMKKERLVELAEGSLAPSEEELQMLAADEGLRREFEELRGLFAALRGLPQPEIDQAAVEGLIPALRAEIGKRRESANPFRLAARPAFVLSAAGAAAVALAAVFILSTWLSTSGPETLPFDTPLAAVEQTPLEVTEEMERAVFDVGSLIAEASSITEIELFADVDETAISESDLYFQEDSTISLIESIASDDTSLAMLEQNFAPDRERFEKILKALKNS
jgi:hypothetical protein